MREFAEGSRSVLKTGELLFGKGELVLFLLFAVVFILLGAFGGSFWWRCWLL